jgi:hypothetical protein
MKVTLIDKGEPGMECSYGNGGATRTLAIKIERAVTNPSIEILLKLANQLDVDLNDLFPN